MPDISPAISKHIPGGAMGLVVNAIFRVRAITRRPTSIAIVAALLFAANLVGGFPGVANDDSNSQYAQAVDQHFNDWHPPIMAWLWSIFRLLADGSSPMFCFHIACYWLGFGLIAVALGRTGRPMAAWGILGVGLFPPFLMMNINILKDVGLAVTFLSAFAVLFWYRIQDLKVPFAVIAISIVLLFYGTLVRSNAVFGVAPLLAYLINPQWLNRPWRLLVFSTPVAMLMVPISGLFNHNVLNATPLGVIRALEIFDMTGIAFYSGDVSVFGSGSSFTKQDIDRCYTPIQWDTLSPWGECRFFWNRLAVSQDLQGVEKLDPMAVMGARPNPDLPHRWIAAIIAHPLAYTRHRLAHFSSEIGFRTKPNQGDAVFGVVAGGEVRDSLGDVPATPVLRELVYLYDILKTPAFWLVIGACLLALLASGKSPRLPAGLEAALALVLSGLLYTCAYLIVGVATDFRYQFWSMIATFTALVISFSGLRDVVEAAITEVSFQAKAKASE
ncbi:MAG TPA: hypothetical protein VLJ17_06025 [Xanthobacteraceae bacterium]|nr:hypothetical protein [Xanthobacteraceae bacterium]